MTPDHTDPDQQGVAPAASHDDHRIEATVAAAIAAINTRRWRSLADDLEPELAALAHQVAVETLDQVGATVTPEAQTALEEWARKWARDRGAELIGQRVFGPYAVPVTDAEHSLPASTMRMLAGDLRDAIKSGAGADRLAAILAKSPAFSPERARRIADYETKNALHTATMEAFHRSRTVKGSYWVTAGDGAVTVECLANEAASPVPLGHPFPSLHFMPPAHAGCRCYLAPELIDEGAKASFTKSRFRETESTESTEKAGGKVTRDAFLYMDPQGDPKIFAQCGSCALFLPSKQLCAVIRAAAGGAEHVMAAWSCGGYAFGEPDDDQRILAAMPAEEAGLVQRAVRCENCRFRDGEAWCGLFDSLNKQNSDIFDLDPNIDFYGCCDAQSDRTVGKTMAATLAFGVLAKRHVEPENAEQVPLPLADLVTQADVQHVSWALLRENKARLEQRTVPMDLLIATQALVDRHRVAQDAAAYRERGQGDERPLVLDGDLIEGGADFYFILAGHHHTAALAQEGALELRVQVLTGEIEDD